MKKYKFEFFFTEKYLPNFDRYFSKKMRLPIWRKGEPENTMTAEFIDYSMKEDRIIGHMNVLLHENIDLCQIDNKVYLMNHPDNLVGRLELLELVETSEN